MIQSAIETFRREKSARNKVVSSTREFWNFIEVRDVRTHLRKGSR